MINISVFNKDKITITIFLVLSLFITLFPPFSWGDERLATEKERNKTYNNKKAIDILPIKQYDFIFNSSKKEFSFGWSWIENPRKYIGYRWESTGGKSVEIKASLSRHIIISELLINYLLAFIISLIIYVLKNKIFNKRKN